jgi:hypothetical protein
MASPRETGGALPNSQDPRAMLQAGLVPVPDPTKLTTDAVAALKSELTYITDLRFEALESLLLEKFKGVSTEFAMRDIALAAAFKAAEAQVKQQNESNTLAIDKSGTAFTKQIEGLDDKIDDLKDRMTIMESRTAGITIANTENRNVRNDAHNQTVDSNGNRAIVISATALVSSIAISVLLHFVK